MSPQPIDNELGELIIRKLDGDLNEEETRRLETLLSEDPASVQYYAKAIINYALLSDKAGIPLSEESGEGLFSIQNMDTPSVPGTTTSERWQLDARKQEIARQAKSALEQFKAQERREQERLAYQAYCRQRRRLVVGLSSLAASLAILIFVWLYPAAEPERANPTARPIPVLPVEVATIVKAKDARWDDTSFSTAVGTRLNTSPLFLRQGWVQIALDRGAEVILQAPIGIELFSDNQIKMASGSITATVPKRAQGFTVNTPDIDVVDFGTEFGVQVGGQQHVEVHVFDGEVGLGEANRAEHMPLQRLTEGYAASAQADGRLHREPLETRPQLFQRHIPDGNQVGIPGKQLDLADVVAGGNGYGTGRSGIEIHPLSGGMRDTWGGNFHNRAIDMEADRLETLMDLEWPHESPKRSPSHFSPTPSHDYIDGVFIPDGGSGPVIVSTLGNRFVACPDTSGRYDEGIISSLFFRHQRRCDIVISGRWITKPGTRQSFIYMHSNLGITFNLDAIRQALPSLALTTFKALAAVADSGRDDRGDAQFYILVDGRIRWRHPNLGTGDTVPVHVSLQPQDRFLSLVTLEGENHVGALDRCVFVEPVLELTRQEGIDSK